MVQKSYEITEGRACPPERIRMLHGAVNKYFRDDGDF